uniref:Apolipoprotein A-I-like n=1 Tax=Myripristis murdjan TaxID=586833 RepID=A0A667Y5Q3_9TELE
MKVLVVFTLAIFTGCQANLFYADEPKPQLEVLTDAFWDYVAKATQTADDTLQMIKKSQFGQDVNADIASRYAVTLQEQLPPMAQDLMTKITTEAEVLRESLSQDLSTLAPYAESLDSEALKTTLMQKSEELKTSLEQSFQELQSQLGPYTEELKQKVDQHLQDFKEKVVPMTERVQVEVLNRAQQVKDLVAPYAEDLSEKLDPYAQDLRARLISLYQSFVSAK